MTDPLRHLSDPLPRLPTAAGHLADRLITQKKWTVLSVRRLMTTVGLVGPAVFLLLFCGVTNLPAALL